MQLEQEREEKVRREREEEARKQEEERRKKEEEEQERERKRLDKIQKREERRREREMKRKEKREERKKREEERRYQLKIQMEERRFLIAQRKLESIRLLTELFNRVRAIKIQDDLELREKELELEKQRQVELEKQRKEEEKQKKKEAKMKKKMELQKQEDELRNKILKNFRKREEQKEEEMREKLREKLAGTCKVKSAVIMKKKLKEVMNERNDSVDLYGYGTMNNWDQSLMDENYRQWAMAFYSYWYQRSLFLKNVMKDCPMKASSYKKIFSVFGHLHNSKQNLINVCLIRFQTSADLHIVTHEQMHSFSPQMNTKCSRLLQK
ncbi:hypothetical protein KUTeg_024311 [Tegillarca granosa]|uniref:Uncharacterized protein n=1 Tax=Tegillarca granosa TaxID=220873 RepID=A0ABQ9E2M3_TEGGR|nr:hypothetical protein KUTeg_024311 [Tegillarca granosa]